MKKHIIEIVVDKNGDVFAETKGMQGEVCAGELDKILEDIKGNKKIKNTSDYYKNPISTQTITIG